MPKFDLKHSVRDRIAYFMERMGITTHTAAAHALGIPRTTLQSIMRRDRIRHDTAERIARFAQLELDWIERGKGPMSKVPFPSSTEDDFLEDAGFDLLDDYSDRLDGEPETGEDAYEFQLPRLPEPDTTNFMFVPKTTGRVSAGGGLHFAFSEIPQTKLAFRRQWLEKVASDPGRVLVMTVEGDSMEPVLFDGDLVMIDLGRRRLKTGTVFAISMGGIVVLKFVDLLPGRAIRLISKNPSYPPLEVEIDDLRVVGQVIWSARTWV